MTACLHPAPTCCAQQPKGSNPYISEANERDREKTPERFCAPYVFGCFTSISPAGVEDRAGAGSAHDQQKNQAPRGCVAWRWAEVESRKGVPDTFSSGFAAEIRVTFLAAASQLRELLAEATT